ncbi:MAG: SAM-dependent methyltransferase [Planctomycetota bacterium]
MQEASETPDRSGTGSHTTGGPARRFVSRGGLKLRHALDEFGIDPTGLRCADLGCSVGGFTDCLLHANAASVIAVDTAYGQLAYTLRRDTRVTVRERTNALHADPPEDPVDLVVIDLGWTPQRLVIPVALRWVRPGGRIITLIKPHYEATDNEKSQMTKGVLPDELALNISERAADEIAGYDPTPHGSLSIEGLIRSPIRGSAKKSKSNKDRSEGVGNYEWLALISTSG